MGFYQKDFNGDIHGDYVNGDKYYFNQNLYAEMSITELELELKRCIGKRNEINKKFFPILGMFFSGLIFLGISLYFLKTSSLLFPAIALIITYISFLYIGFLDGEYKLARQKYRQAIDEIKFELNDRK